MTDVKKAVLTEMLRRINAEGINETEQLDEISNSLKRRWLDAAIQKYHDDFSRPADPKNLTPKKRRLKTSWINSPEAKMRNKKLRIRHDTIQKAAKSVTGRTHYDKMDGKPSNAGDWNKGKRYTTDWLDDEK